MEKITVSQLPNIHFYSGPDSKMAGEAVENRRYGTHSTYYGDLMRSNDYNSYWNGQGLGTSMFGENPTDYQNIGDIINATITYMNKFKNNSIDIKVDKNILTFDYDFENDLAGNFDNTYTVPSSVLQELLLNVNDMRFNKQNYYRNNLELKDVSYMHKKYPYQKEGTIFNIKNIVNGEEIIEYYDFSRQFVDFRYNEIETEHSYLGYVMRPVEQEDGSIAYIPTSQTYTGIYYEYSYEVSDINYLEPRISKFFEDNTSILKENRGDLATYYISDLNSVITLSLNTYSLGKKNLYAYFNFNSNYNNWFYNSIAFKTDIDKLSDGQELIKINPYSEDYFGVNTSKDANNVKKISSETMFTISSVNDLNEETKFEIVNPSNIKGLDFTPLNGEITDIDLINQYSKKLNVNESGNTNWIIEGGTKIESLKFGSEEITDNKLKNLKGVNSITSLKELDITNCSNISKNVQISNLKNLESFKAKGSNITAFVPKSGLKFKEIALPNTLKTLTLKNITAEKFEYEPTSNLINVTIEEVGGIDTQKLVMDWVHSLDETSLLYDGIITNTNLTGIDWSDYPVDRMLRLRYLGINKFSGKISIISSTGDEYISRQEYLDLRKVFGDEIMVAGKYTSNSKPIKFSYKLDPNAYIKKAFFYYYDDIIINGEIISTRIKDTTLDYKFNILDTSGGASLLNYFDMTESIEFNKNKEGFGYEATLNENIYTDNNEKSSQTKNLVAGDVVIYKGNKLILVFRNQTTVYSYTKVGTFMFTQSNANKILISFKDLE